MQGVDNCNLFTAFDISVFVYYYIKEITSKALSFYLFIYSIVSTL